MGWREQKPLKNTLYNNSVTMPVLKLHVILRHWLIKDLKFQEKKIHVWNLFFFFLDAIVQHLWLTVNVTFELDLIFLTTCMRSGTLWRESVWRWICPTPWRAVIQTLQLYTLKVSLLSRQAQFLNLKQNQWSIWKQNHKNHTRTCDCFVQLAPLIHVCNHMHFHLRAH